MNHFTYMKCNCYKFNDLPKKYLKLWNQVIDFFTDDLEDYDSDMSITEWKCTIDDEDYTLIEVIGYPGDNDLGGVFYGEKVVYFGGCGDFFCPKESTCTKFDKYLEEFNHFNLSLNYLQSSCEEHPFCKEQYQKHQEILKKNKSPKMDSITNKPKVKLVINNSTSNKIKSDETPTVVIVSNNRGETIVNIKLTKLLPEESEYIDFKSDEDYMNSFVAIVFGFLISEHPLRDDFDYWLRGIQKVDKKFTKEKMLKINNINNKWRNTTNISELNNLTKNGMKFNVYILNEKNYEGELDY